MPRSSQRLLAFRDRPASAILRRDVDQSVQRSIEKLPVLGARNPDAALLIERNIDDWMPPGVPTGGDHLAPRLQRLPTRATNLATLKPPTPREASQILIAMLQEMAEMALDTGRRDDDVLTESA